MTYYCKLCDRTMKSLSKYKHFKSKTHSCFKNSIIRRSINLDPNFDEVDETMRKYVNNQNKKHEEYDVRCLIKLSTTRNRFRYIRINSQLSLHYSFYVPKKSTFSKINQDRHSFSQIFAMRITFISSIRHMAYDHKKTMSMCEIKLNQILSRNPNLINCSNRNTFHPMIRKYSHYP